MRHENQVCVRIQVCVSEYQSLHRTNQVAVKRCELRRTRCPHSPLLYKEILLRFKRFLFFAVVVSPN